MLKLSFLDDSCVKGGIPTVNIIGEVTNEMKELESNSTFIFGF